MTEKKVSWRDFFRIAAGLTAATLAGCKKPTDERTTGEQLRVEPTGTPTATPSPTPAAIKKTPGLTKPPETPTLEPPTATPRS